jgi:hypothetical protein
VIFHRLYKVSLNESRTVRKLLHGHLCVGVAGGKRPRRHQLASLAGAVT